MPSKKSGKKRKKGSTKSREKGASRVHGSNGRGRTYFHGGSVDDLPEIEFDFSDYPGPRYPNPETPEEREKRLAARKALTLRAFQTTYENRRRKSS